MSDDHNDKIVYADFSTSKTEMPEGVKFTEDFQAKAFVDLQDDNIRYVEENDQWYKYNGIYWEEISRLEMIESARLMNRGTALAVNKSPVLQRQLSSRRFAQNVEGYSRGDERCLLPMEELDKDPWLLGTPGGIIDLQTGRYIGMGLKPYVTMVTTVAPATVADEHSCPRFLKFMDEFTCGDKDLKRYLLQYAGYCLTGDMREQCLIFLFGDGDNGKTVFIRILQELLGNYAMRSPIELFVTAGAGKHLTGFAAMHRKRCVVTNETEKGHMLRMGVIKDITGQEPMRANFMRQDTFEFRPVCKLVMFGNHKPSLPNVGKADKKRIRMIPCNLQLAKHEMDRDLAGKMLANEGPGILRAIIDACLDWQKHGLITPECVEEQTENYFYTQDTFSKWLESCCELGPNTKDTSTVLWRSWQTWTKENNIGAGDETAFSESLREKGFQYVKNIMGSDGKYHRGWRGVAMARDVNPANIV
jgi:putative DNA primase/helicase